MKTLEEVKDLVIRFNNYKETAEQDEIPLLLMDESLMAITMNKIVSKGIENCPQEEIEQMFRTIELLIGE